MSQNTLETTGGNTVLTNFSGATVGDPVSREIQRSAETSEFSEHSLINFSDSFQNNLSTNKATNKGGYNPSHTKQVLFPMTFRIHRTISIDLTKCFKSDLDYYNDVNWQT